MLSVQSRIDRDGATRCLPFLWAHRRTQQTEPVGFAGWMPSDGAAGNGQNCAFYKTNGSDARPVSARDLAIENAPQLEEILTDLLHVKSAGDRVAAQPRGKIGATHIPSATAALPDRAG